jgi:hypothetical protein
MLTQSRLKEILKYSPDTGEFVHLVQKKGGRGIKPGDVAGDFCSYGYRRIGIDGKRYRACRLAWLYMTGEWPEKHVDHVNGIRSDDRWENLRSASIRQNAFNRGVSQRNSVGIKGVGVRDIKGATYAYADCRAGDVRKTSFYNVKKLGLMVAVARAAIDAKAIRESLHGEFATHAREI